MDGVDRVRAIGRPVGDEDVCVPGATVSVAIRREIAGDVDRAQQEQLASQMTGAMSGMSGAMGGQPWNVFDPAAMQEMQREYQKRLASFWTGAMPGMPGMAPAAAAPAPKNAEPAAANDAEELKALRARLEELEKKAAKK